MNAARPHAIVHRQQIMEWRDRQSSAAMVSLNRAWGDFRPVIVEQLASVGWGEALRSPNAFIRDCVDPKIVGYFEPIIAENILTARTELEALLSNDLIIDTKVAHSTDEEDYYEAALDLLKSVAPLAGGLAVGAAIPSMAVLSGTAMLGLVATSTISLPVVFGGLAVAGAGVATGAIKTSALRTNATERMLAKVDRHVARSLLDPEMDERKPAVLARLLHSYKTTAAVALGDD